MAIGRGLGGELAADDAVRARAVIHQDLLSQAFAQLAGDKAREEIVAARRQESDDDPDRARTGVGALLCSCMGRREKRKGERA